MNKKILLSILTILILSHSEYLMAAFKRKTTTAQPTQPTPRPAQPTQPAPRPTIRQNVSNEWLIYLRDVLASDNITALQDGLAEFDKTARPQFTIQKEAQDLLNQINNKIKSPTRRGPLPQPRPRPVSTDPTQIPQGQDVMALHQAALQAAEKVVIAARIAGQNEIADKWEILSL